jgi:hypothetical protein
MSRESLAYRSSISVKYMLNQDPASIFYEECRNSDEFVHLFSTQLDAVTALNISHSCITAEMRRKIGKTLTKMANLESVILEFNELAEEVIYYLIGILSQVKELSCTSNIITSLREKTLVDDQLLPIVLAVAESHKIRKEKGFGPLKKLYLNGPKLGNYAFGLDHAETLSTVLPHLQNLTLDLSQRYNPRNINLRDFPANKSPIKFDGIEKALKIISEEASRVYEEDPENFDFPLEVLAIKGYGIKDSDLEVISSCIESVNGLINLDLSFNNLSHRGALEVASLFARSRYLTKINLSGNNFALVNSNLNGDLIKHSRFQEVMNPELKYANDVVWAFIDIIGSRAVEAVVLGNDNELFSKKPRFSLPLEADKKAKWDEANRDIVNAIFNLVANSKAIPRRKRDILAAQTFSVEEVVVEESSELVDLTPQPPSLERRQDSFQRVQNLEESSQSFEQNQLESGSRRSTLIPTPPKKGRESLAEDFQFTTETEKSNQASTKFLKEESEPVRNEYFVKEREEEPSSILKVENLSPTKTPQGQQL